MKKAAIYGMASARDKTLESQLSELRNYAKLRGWEVHQEYLDRHIIEVGKSGPALARLMKDARDRKFDILLVWKFDKFARSTTHLATTLEELEDLGIDFCSHECVVRRVALIVFLFCVKQHNHKSCENHRAHGRKLTL